MGRALANWFIENGIDVIPNVRVGDNRTYDFVFDGLNNGDIVAIGTIGTCRKNIERKILVEGIRETIHRLNPSNIIIYGSLPKEIEAEYPNLNFCVFESNNFKKLKVKKHG